MVSEAGNQIRSALVTGGSGVVGPTLIRRLLEKNYRVRALVRSKNMPNLTGVEWVYGDITDFNSVRAAVDGMDVVYHLAAKLHINNPGSDLEAEYRRVNVEGTRVLVDASKQAGVSRLVFFSTIAVYGPTSQDQILDETSPIRPESVYARTKADAEKIVLEWDRGVVLRVSSVCGQGMKGNYVSMLKALDRRIFCLVGDGNNRRTMIHVKDLCEAAILAGEDPQALGRIYNVSDGRFHTLFEIVRSMSASLGRSAPRFRIPLRPARGLVQTLDAIARATRLPLPSATYLLDKLNEDVAIRSDRIQIELGFRPQQDLQSAWRDVLAERSS